MQLEKINQKVDNKIVIRSLTFITLLITDTTLSTNVINEVSNNSVEFNRYAVMVGISGLMILKTIGVLVAVIFCEFKKRLQALQVLTIGYFIICLWNIFAILISR